MPRLTPNLANVARRNAALCAPQEVPRVRHAEAIRRQTLRAAKAANRRRALPLWTRTTLRWSLRLVPLAAVAAASIWSWQSGTLHKAVTGAHTAALDATATAGFAVAEVLVTGRDRTGADDVLAALGVARGSPILGFDPAGARAALQAIPWVAEARVERHLPDTILVVLTERRPMALWQHERQVRLVDAHGVVLGAAELADWPDLPLLVGPAAPDQAKDLLALLLAEPSIGARVEAAVLVGGRRWDLRLDNGVDVRLPESDVAAALRQLAMVQAGSGLLERDIAAVDLRVPDRLAVQTSARAAEARRTPPEPKI